MAPNCSHVTTPVFSQLSLWVCIRMHTHITRLQHILSQAFLATKKP